MRDWIFKRLKTRAVLMIICIMVPLIFSYKGIHVNAMNSKNENTSLDAIVIESEEVVITIHYGLDQQARYGRDVLLSAEIESKTLSGRYEYGFILADGQNSNDKYSTKVELAKNHVSKVEITIPLIKEIKKIKIYLYDEKGNTIVEEVNAFQAMNYGPYKLVGIISDKLGNMQYLNAFGTKCFELNESNFPNKKDGLDMLDVIVINDFDTSKLSNEQFNALKEFVFSGGSLVLGTGNYFDKVMGPFIKQDILNIKGINKESDLKKLSITTNNIRICTEETFSELLELISMYENNRINTLARLEERSANNTIDPNKLYIGNSMVQDTLISQLKIQPIKKEIVDFTITNASNILVENDRVLLQKSLYGKGNILVASFNMSMSKKDTEITKVHTGYLELANIIYNNLPSGYQSKLDSESYGTFSGWQDAVKISDSSSLPSIGVIVAILLFYVTIVGPGIYFLLKRFGKSIYLWGLVPLLTVIFILLIYANGSKTRITKPFIGFVTVEQFDDIANKIEGTMTLRLSFPTNKDSSIIVDGVDTIHMVNSNYPFYPLFRNDGMLQNDTYLDMTIFHSGVTFLENAVQIEVANKPAFSSSFYETLYEYESSPVIKGNIQLNEEKISGTVENVTDDVINDAYVYSNGILVSLGKIDSKEVVQIESYPQENLLSSEMLYMSNLLEGMLEYNEKAVMIPNTNRKLQVMRKVIEELPEEQSTSFFISLTEELEKENPFYELSKGKGSYGTRVLLIPLEENNENDSQALVASMDKYMSVTGGGNNYIEQFRYMFAKSMIVDYYLPSDETITEIFASGYLNQTIAGKETTLVCENVYFYNNETKKYDLVFEFNKFNLNSSMVQRVGKEKLKHYLTSNNHLRVKYENSTIGDDVSILPCLSYYKEISHVKD